MEKVKPRTLSGFMELLPAPQVHVYRYRLPVYSGRSAMYPVTKALCPLRLAMGR